MGEDAGDFPLGEIVEEPRGGGDAIFADGPRVGIFSLPSDVQFVIVDIKTSRLTDGGEAVTHFSESISPDFNGEPPWARTNPSTTPGTEEKIMGISTEPSGSSQNIGPIAATATVIAGLKTARSPRMITQKIESKMILTINVSKR